MFTESLENDTVRRYATGTFITMFVVTLGAFFWLTRHLRGSKSKVKGLKPLDKAANTWKLWTRL